MPTQHSSFNNNESWLLINKLKHWTKFNTLLKFNFFLSLISTIDAPKFHLNVCCVSLCSDYQVLNPGFARFIVEAYYHHWLLLSRYALIVIVNCSCWLVYQMSKLTCVLIVKTQHWLLALVFASIVNIDACINYQLYFDTCIDCQHQQLHQLSSSICALTFCKSCSIIEIIIAPVVTLGFW